MNKLLVIASLFSLVFYACTATGPYSATNKIYKKQAKELARSLMELPGVSPNNPADFKAGTTNFNLRKPNYVIIHHTAQNSCEQTLKTFTMPKTEVSAHYVICKDGTVHHMLNDYLRAWHGGVAKWGSVTDINSVSLGIELDNNGTEEFPESQLGSLLTLLQNLKKSYNIPAPNFIGHSDIAPSRKQDPSSKFPWKRLAESGFGNWYDSVLDTVPPAFNHLQGLKIIGYDVKDTTAAIKAFKLHFIQTDINPILGLNEKAIINNLSKKY
ncbi:MAG: N-acetylmuramoyl-L-alanine amidase [Sphingobacteriaceae bacterium]|nr:N-acetylmuramoyl-L-alanine amidase [Sphingobacteriaceae bacterium]